MVLLLRGQVASLCVEGVVKAVIQSLTLGATVVADFQQKLKIYRKLRLSASTIESWRGQETRKPASWMGLYCQMRTKKCLSRTMPPMVPSDEQIHLGE